jgi:ABC-2 type transport system permease protein
MKRLLSIELNKLRKYRAFWILTGLYYTSVAITLLSVEGVLNGFFEDAPPGPMKMLGGAWAVYNFPDSWHYLTYIASLFHHLLAIIVVITICAEFNYKTIRQNIINGMSRADWMAGKVLLLSSFALATTLMIFVIGMILGLIKGGYDGIGDIVAQMSFLAAYFIQLLGYLSLAMLFGILIRNTGIAIGVYMIYAGFGERILWYYLPDSVDRFLPMASFDYALPSLLMGKNNNPLMVQDYLDPLPVVMSIVYIFLLIGLGYWLIKRKDL